MTTSTQMANVNFHHDHDSQQANIYNDPDYNEYRQFQRFKQLMNDPHWTKSDHLRNHTYKEASANSGTGYLGQQFAAIANPAPVGLMGFALTTFVLSMHNAGAGVATSGPNGVVNGLALFYGGIVQFAAGMWEMRTGNTFGAVAFASYGGFWMSYAALFINAFGFLDGYSANEHQLHHSLGIYLLGWTIFTFIMMIASHRTTLALFSLFFILTITFLLLTIGEWAESVNCTQAGGAFGIFDACIAWYCAMAGMLSPSNSVFRLPVYELKPWWAKRGHNLERNTNDAVVTKHINQV